MTNLINHIKLYSIAHAPNEYTTTPVLTHTVYSNQPFLC